MTQPASRQPTPAESGSRTARIGLGAAVLIVLVLGAFGIYYLFLAPFTPSPDRVCNGCPPLVQPWTKWVVGPGERGEPAGTTSLGWGPLDPGATLTIPLVATRRINGPVDFDLQLLAGEALLQLETGQPAWLRVSVP